MERNFDLLTILKAVQANHMATNMGSRRTSKTSTFAEATNDAFEKYT
jgi:hypothetical protein